MHNHVHLFNPGSAGRANKGAPVSVGFLTREKGQPSFAANVVLLLAATVYGSSETGVQKDR